MTEILEFIQPMCTSNKGEDIISKGAIFPRNSVPLESEFPRNINPRERYISSLAYFDGFIRGWAYIRGKVYISDILV